MRRRTIVTGRTAYALALALTALVCGILWLLRDIMPSGEIALVFTLAVLGSAALGGVRAGLLAAVCSFAAMIYLFMPPIYSLAAGRPSDWLTLAVFVLVAGIGGWGTGRLREREDIALEGEEQAEEVAALTARLVTQSSPEAAAGIVTTEIARMTGAARVTVLVAGESGGFSLLSGSGHDDILSDAGIERFATWVVENGKPVGLPATAGSPEATDSVLLPLPESVTHDAIVPGAQRADAFIPVSTASRVEGVLYIGPVPRRFALDRAQVRAIVLLAQLMGAFLERSRLEAIASRAETIREAERLKATLMSSVSHELKTPLAAMTATVSGLVAADADVDADRMREDLRVVEEGLARLSASISDLLDLSRLESDSWTPRRDAYEVGEIVGSLLSRMSADARARTQVRIPEGLAPIEVDFVQMSRALSNLLENALQYSGESGRVTIGARFEEPDVEVWVEDDGPGIPEAERSRVFEKFYRGSASVRVPSGTGLGLTITQEIVRFNGGTIEVEPAWPRGARFLVRMPAAPPLPTPDLASGGSVDGDVEDARASGTRSS